jgi:hypothetical protein
MCVKGADKHERCGRLEAKHYQALLKWFTVCHKMTLTYQALLKWFTVCHKMTLTVIHWNNSIHIAPLFVHPTET